MWPQETEAAYLRHNPDVARLVRLRLFSSGYAHFSRRGFRQKRRWWSPEDVAAAKAKGEATRLCLDPWNYYEISANGGVRPCCNYSILGKLDVDRPTSDNRTGGKFRELRGQLLSGKLSPICSRCHIRELVPLEAERQYVEAHARAAKVDDPLSGHPLRSVRIDINEKCNLRCTYCAVSSPTYRGTEMDERMFVAALALIREGGDGVIVNVNGHGETTFHPQWLDYVGRIRSISRRLSIITNLARRYTDEEIDMLSRFATIAVSLDSADPETTRTIRKAVKVDTILDNIARIRRAAWRKLRLAPRIDFSVGLYDPSIWRLEEMVDLLVRQRAHSIRFWNLVEMPHQENVRALERLNDEERLGARRNIEAARRRLDSAGIRYHFAGDFRAKDGFGFVPASLEERDALDERVTP